MGKLVENTKLYYEAVGCLPTRFIDEATEFKLLDKERILVANRNFAPMIYVRGSGVWTPLKLRNRPFARPGKPEVAP